MTAYTGTLHCTINYVFDLSYPYINFCCCMNDWIYIEYMPILHVSKLNFSQLLSRKHHQQLITEKGMRSYIYGTDFVLENLKINHIIPFKCFRSSLLEKVLPVLGWVKVFVVLRKQVHVTNVTNVYQVTFMQTSEKD